MTTLEIRKSIHHSIDQIQDEHLLEAINMILLEIMDNDVVGYLTKADLIRKVLQAEKNILEGFQKEEKNKPLP